MKLAKEGKELNKKAGGSFPKSEEKQTQWKESKETALSSIKSLTKVVAIIYKSHKSRSSRRKLKL